jgi:hypothetical protein
MIDNVQQTSNSICEDGQPGAAGYPDGESLCALGSDVSDCGARPCIASAGRRASELEPLIEFWVSRSPARFGTRCSSAPYEQTASTALLRCVEDNANAEGSLVFVRAFNLNSPLRIQGLKVYGPLPRRLAEEEHKDEPKDEPKEDAAARARLLSRMLSLTREACGGDEGARLRASMLWAEAHDARCTCCETGEHIECKDWFAREHHGVAGDRQRRARRQLKEEEQHRRLKVEEAVGKACCRVRKSTGEKECGRQFCKAAVKKTALEHISRTLRALHDNENSDVDLSPSQLFATDVLLPELHHDSSCRDSAAHSAECMAKSIAAHVSRKHGIDSETLHSHLASAGLSIARMLADGDTPRRPPPDSAREEAPPREKARVKRTPRQPGGKPLTSARTAVGNTASTSPAPKRTARRKRASGVASYANSLANFSASVASTLRRRQLSFPEVPDTPSAVDFVSTIVSAQGGVISGVSSAAASIGNLAQRAGGAIERASSTPPPRRQLREEHLRIFDELEAKFPGVGLEVPPSGVASYREELRYIVEEGHRVGGILSARAAAGRRLHEKHSTGWRLLDARVPSSPLGSALRRLHAWLHRRGDYEEAGDVENTEESPGVAASLMRAAIREENPFHAAVGALEKTPKGRMRRLADSALSAAGSLPVFLGKKAVGSYSDTDVSPIEEMARWAVYSGAPRPAPPSPCLHSLTAPLTLRQSSCATCILPKPTRLATSATDPV